MYLPKASSYGYINARHFLTTLDTNTANVATDLQDCPFRTGGKKKLNIKKQNDKSKVKKRAYRLAPAVTGFVEQLPKGWASAAISDKLLRSKEHKAIFLHFYLSF